MMKTKKENTKTTQYSDTRLTSYSALAAVFIAIGAQAEAQIFYSEIPDVLLDENGESYAIDLNGDLINDVELRKVFISFYDASLVTAGSGYAPGIAQLNHIYATPLGSNSIAGIPSPYAFSSYASALYCFSVINDTRQWVNNASEILVYSRLYMLDGSVNLQVNENGEWFGGATDRYLGVKLHVSGSTKFGWIRMDVSSDNKVLTIKDYAFENTASLEILAGAPNVDPEVCDTGDVIILHEIPAEDVFAYSFENNIYLSVKNNNLLGSHISVFSVTGQLIYSAVMDEQNKTIVLTNQPAGMYYLRLVHEQTQFAKQVFIATN